MPIGRLAQVAAVIVVMMVSGFGCRVAVPVDES
jgi:hypothetical protein